MYHKNLHNQQLIETLLPALPNFKVISALILKFIRYTIKSIYIDLFPKNTGAKQFQPLLINDTVTTGLTAFESTRRNNHHARIGLN